MASTRDVISRWPDDVRESVYFELQALQTGMKAASSDIGDWVEPGRKGAPPKHKSMRTAFGRHARQLTIKSEDSYRVVYISKFKEAVYVIHAFMKKTEGIQKKDYSTAKKRYKNVEQYRKEEGLK